MGGGGSKQEEYDPWGYKQEQNPWPRNSPFHKMWEDRNKRNRELNQANQEVKQKHRADSKGHSKKQLRKHRRRELNNEVWNKQWYKEVCQAYQDSGDLDIPGLPLRLDNLLKATVEREKTSDDFACECGIRYKANSLYGPTREDVAWLGYVARLSKREREDLLKDSGVWQKFRKARGSWLVTQRDLCEEGDKSCLRTLKFIQNALNHLTKWSGFDDALLDTIKTTGSLTLSNEGSLSILQQKMIKFGKEIGSDLGEIISEKVLEPLDDPDVPVIDKLLRLEQFLNLEKETVETLIRKLEEQRPGFWDTPVGQNALGGAIACGIICIPTGLGTAAIIAYRKKLKAKLAALKAATTTGSHVVDKAIEDASKLLKKVGETVNNINIDDAGDNMDEIIQKLEEDIKKIDKEIEDVKSKVEDGDYTDQEIELAKDRVSEKIQIAGPSRSSHNWENWNLLETKNGVMEWREVARDKRDVGGGFIPFGQSGTGNLPIGGGGRAILESNFGGMFSIFPMIFMFVVRRVKRYTSRIRGGGSDGDGSWDDSL